MSLLQHAFDARLLIHSIRRMVGRTAARFVLRLQRRPARLIEEKMPDWQLRDLGFRDGRPRWHERAASVETKD